MKTINCADCNVVYEYEPAKGYPDKRKYCANCSEKKKASWNEKKEAPMAEIVKNEQGEIVEVVDMNEVVQLSQPEFGKPKKSYELTDGNIRIGALTCAIELRKLEGGDHIEIWKIVKEFEEYIRNGK